MIFSKHRFEIWNGLQHPYKHTLGDFSYTNPAAPGVTSIESAFNWIYAVLYPNTQAAVATVGDLPALGNTLNDYRVVQDDGDGHAASYRWELREGEVSASWHKVFDMDWGSNSILEAFQLRTQDLYVHRRGYDDLDGSGAVVSGLYAGQVVTGGLTASSNLTLRANAGDGVGARTGFVQVDDQFRPTVTNLFDIGTSAIKFKDFYLKGVAYIDTMTISTGSIIDSTGQISFDNENLLTTGNVTATNGYFTSTAKIGPLAGNRLNLSPGSITDDTGAIDFGDETLSTDGMLYSSTHTITSFGGIDTLEINANSGGKALFTSSLGLIGFGTSNLSGSGNLQFVQIVGLTSVKGGNLKLTGNTFSSENTNGNIILLPNGTGIVDIQKAITALGADFTGTVGVVGQLNADNLRFDGNIISSTSGGLISLQPDTSGYVETKGHFQPQADATYSLGITGKRFTNIWFSGDLKDGTNTFLSAELFSLRNVGYRDAARTLPAQAGDTLFWDTVSSTWLADHPDSEITHNSLSGLTTGDAGHTQFAMLAGRAGGQTLQGGTVASENLILESTAHATKGDVFTKDDFLPFTNASYSGGWSGTDLGDGTHYFRDLYTKGELFGARLQNVTSGTLPSASAQNIGRVVYATDNNKAYVDTGTLFKVLGVSKYVSDTSWNGTDTTKNVTVSGSVDDARNCLWQLRDNANDFEIMGVKLTTPDAATVTITVNVPLAAGSYRLIGLE